TDFEVQYWNGSSWTTVQNGKVANNKVLTKIVFPAVTTNRIRVVISSGQSGYSRLVEVEAWGN
ncbi:MAG: type domain protein, partial [Acidobacteria bacterium]|nr:type domain protein [Acidobacteriota bacterium]